MKKLEEYIKESISIENPSQDFIDILDNIIHGYFDIDRGISNDEMKELASKILNAASKELNK